MVVSRQPLATLSALLLLGLAGLAQAEPAAGLVPHAAEYKVKISVLGGRLTTMLEATEDGYRAESLIRATGMSRIIARGEIRESSEFALTPDGVRPRRFISSDGLSKGKETVDFTFDWQTGTVSGMWNNAPFENQFDGVMHDRVSLQYGLMHDLMNGIQRAEYFLQDAEKFKPLTITTLGVESVTVPYGVFEATGIQHQAEGSSRITTLWVVEELGYLPVIIEQHRKGKLQVRAVLTDYQPATGS